MSLDNLGYIIITLFFMGLFLVAYLFRRKNNNSDEFVGIIDDTPYLSIQLNLGIVEFTILAVLGARFGFSGFYFAIVAIIIAYLFWVRYDSNDNQNSFVRYVHLKSSKIDSVNFKKINLRHDGSSTVIDAKGVHHHLSTSLTSLGIFSIVLAGFQLVAYLGLICLSMIITEKIFSALLGWSFANSILTISGFVLVYSLIGGYKAIRINKLISHAVILLVLVIALSIAYFKLGRLKILYDNLKHLAITQGFPSNYYTDFNFSVNWLGIIGMLFLGIVGLNILNNKVNSIRVAKFNSTNIALKIIVAQLVVMCGVIAIGTSPATRNIDGREVVTYQTQLPNGEIGYVVRSIADSPESSLKSSGAGMSVPDASTSDAYTPGAPVLGIIPLNINSKTNLVDPGMYNYILSGVVAVEHYLPKKLQFLVALMILALFITSLSQYLIRSSRVFIKDIVEPLDLFSKYGETGRLWLSRVVIGAMLFISLSASYFMFPGFDLMIYIYILLSIFLVPFFIILVILSAVK
jgi:hypothetical protein